MRYFHVYGPRQDCSERGGVVSIFISRMLKGLPPIIYGDGFQQRSFTYVGDVVNANLFFMDNDLRGVFNVATGDHISLLTLVEYLNSIMNTDFEPDFQEPTIGDIRYFNVSNEKLIKQGFSFTTIFKEGLRNTVDYIYKNLT
jgi:UDP-glucose 4-epimerase